EVEAEGRYGFTLIPKSGVGLSAPPPARNDPPQLWVEVDVTPPRVLVQKVEVGRGVDSGSVTIFWTADDKQQLADNPISISYAKEPGGPWTPIATQLPNKGSYVWKMDEKTVPFLFYIKVEATDLANNVGSDVQKEAVKVDLKVPRIDNIIVEP